MRAKPFFTILIFILYSLYISAQPIQTFNIFSYTSPKDFVLKENKDKLFLIKTEGKNYCQLFIYPAVTGEKDVEKDFTKNWDFFARNPGQKIGDPETKELDSLNGWQIVFGAARGTFNKQMFALTLSTYTKDSLTYYIAAVFTDKKFIPIAQDFIANVVPDENKFTFVSGNENQPVQHANADTNTDTAVFSAISKSITHFDDGWTATVTNDYVEVTKASTELRLHYIDKALDDARPNTIDAPEYYWSKYVEPYFNTSNLQKWSGVQYPVIYHMMANAVEKKQAKIVL